MYIISGTTITPAIARAVDSLVEKAATLLKHVFITSVTIKVNKKNVL